MIRSICFTLFVFILSPLISAELTLEKDWLASHGIDTYDRYDKDQQRLKIRVHVGNWSANAIINRMAVFILRDALGYEVETVNACRNSTCIFNSIRQNEFDVALGVLKDDLEAYDELVLHNGGSLLGISSYGEMGGLYLPEFVISGSFADLFENVTAARGFEGLNIQMGFIYQNAEVISQAFAMSPTEFISKTDALRTELYDMNYGDPATPYSTFVPDWCKDSQECIEVIAHSEDIHTNVLPALIRNGKRRMTISYWGTERARKIMQYMADAKVPFLAHFWDPEYFNTKLIRMHLTSPTRMCWESHSMMNSDGYNSSVNCDFFPFETIGIAGKISSNLGYQDVINTLQYIDLDRDTIKDLSTTIQGKTDTDVVDKVVKEWFEENIETWTAWVKNSPDWHRYGYMDDDPITFTTIYIAYSLMCIFLIGTLIWHYYYRKHPAVKRKTTKLVYPWLTGQLLCCISFIAFTLDQESVGSCSVFMIGGHIGVSLWILSPALRAYRMAKIFNEELVVFELSNWALIKYLFTFIFMELACCIVMMWLYATNDVKTMTDGDWPTETTNGYLYYVCSCHNNAYRVLQFFLLACKFIYLVALLFLARRTRKVWQTHRESFELTLQGYTSILFIMAIFMLQYMDTPWNFRLIIGTFLMWLAFASCLYFYMFKLVVAVHFTSDDDDNDEMLDDHMFKDMKRSIKHMDVAMLEEMVKYFHQIIELKMLDTGHEEEQTLRCLRREISEMAPISHILTRDQSESRSANYRSYQDVNQGSGISMSERYTDTADDTNDHGSTLSVPTSRGTSAGSKTEVESPRRPKRAPGTSALSPISEIGGVSIEMSSTPTVVEESPEAYNDSGAYFTC